MRLKILGKYWSVRFVPVLGPVEERADADCTDPGDRHKTIRLKSTLVGQELLDALVHEMLHAADWSKDEEWVNRLATDIARAAFRPELAAKIFPAA